MKQIILLTLLLFASCFGLRKSTSNYDNLLNKNEILSLTIAVDPDSSSVTKTRINLTLANNSDKIIIIDNPNIGQNYMLLVKDSKGRLKQRQFRLRIAIDTVHHQLFPDRRITALLQYSLEEFYDISEKDRYDCYLEYYGNIYDTKGNRLTNEKLIISNHIELEVQS